MEKSPEFIEGQIFKVGRKQAFTNDHPNKIINLMVAEEIPESPTIPPEEISPIPISPKAEKQSSFLGRLNIFRKIAERRQSKEKAENQARTQASMEKNRNRLSSMDQHPQKQPEDDVVALAAINRLIDARQATNEDIHKKAIIEATNLANQEKRPLTETDVAEAEARIRSEIPKEPTPFQKTAETSQVPTEEEKVA